MNSLFVKVFFTILFALVYSIIVGTFDLFNFDDFTLGAK